jgi:formate dehydrogenase alpha subunit
MPRLTIDGRALDALPGQTLLEAARAAAVQVPTLCHHRDLSPDGSCRVCVVEVAGWAGPVAACTTPAVDGMEVRTHTPDLVESRRFVLEMLLGNYHDAGYATGDRDGTEFDRLVREYDARPPGGVPPLPRHPTDGDPGPFIRVDLNKCVRCTRCVRACAEVQGRFVWGMGFRGDESLPIAGANAALLDARCESCGACVAYCPTGALDDRTAVGTGRPDRVVPSVCGYCGVGCGLSLHVKNDRVVRVASDPAAPVNGMALCVKGRYGYDYIHHPERLTRPRVRRYLLEGGAKRGTGHGGEWVEVEWDAALGLVANRLAAVRRDSGADAVGFLSSAKCTNEENYLVQKLARQVIGTHNVDHCARLCHSPTVAGLTMALGNGAATNPLDDVAGAARCIFLIGSNVTEQHPVFGTRLRQAVLRRGVPLVVADPRKVEITEFAALHLRHRPGTDVALVNGILHVLLTEGWYDRAFVADRCEGFEEFREAVASFTPSEAESVTGVPAADLHRAAEILARNRPGAVVWAMGITQHTTGVLNVLSLANLQMLLGNLGVSGGGVIPLRGQNNVQGSCDMGALPNVFPGYRPVTDAATRARFDAAWACEPSAGAVGSPSLGLAARPGRTLTDMIAAFGAGAVRALFVLGEDPAMTDPDVNHARACLAAGEFLVLQELFPSETARFADVLLPGGSFAEKAGTFTNTERRVQLIRPAVPPPGSARPDWEVLADLGRRVLEATGRSPAGPHAGWDYRDPAAIMGEVAALTADYTGISHARLARGDRLLWPVPSADHPGTPILYADAFPRGKARFHPASHLPPAELPDADHPFVLTTGRVLYHWHGGEMTRRSKGLTEACPGPTVEVSPDDAARLDVETGSAVRLRSRRGEVVARAVVTDRVAPGVVFGNFHFPGLGNVNNLTSGALDPVARIPEYKVCAVSVEAVAPAADR